MGYRADGSGYIDIITNKDNCAEIAVDVKLMLDDAGFGVFVQQLLPLSIDFGYSGNYYEDDVIGVLNDISNKYEISSGELEFTGEDHESWRFIYRDGVWHTEKSHRGDKSGDEHLYIVCIDEAYTRDIQVMTPDEKADEYFEGEADEFDVEWGDYGSADLYLGYYWAKNQEAAKELAAMYGEDKGFMKVIDTGVTR